MWLAGTFEYANGDEYAGQWYQDTWHGQGKLVTGKGDIYEGGTLDYYTVL